MLLANVLVAKYIFKFCKDKAILRVHNDIVQEKKDKLIEFLDKVGIAGVDLTNAKSLSQSM
jgi:exoribonuclease R